VDVLFAEKASLIYWAVIGCVPTVRVDFVSLAMPPLKAAEPSVVAPSRNFTLPVGAGPVPVTWAVKVTACLDVDGFAEDESEIFVGARASILETNPSIEPPPKTGCKGFRVKKFVEVVPPVT